MPEAWTGANEAVDPVYQEQDHSGKRNGQHDLEPASYPEVEGSSVFTLTLVNVRGPNRGPLVVLQPLAVDGQLRFVVGNDRQPHLLRLASIPGQLQTTMRQDRVLVFLRMIDDLVLVGKGTDIFLIDVFLRNRQVVRTPLFNHCQQLAGVEVMNGPPELNPVVSDPGDGAGGIEDVGGLVTCRPLEDVNGVRHENLSDDEEQCTDGKIATQVEGWFMVVLDKGGGRDGNPQEKQGVGDNRQPVGKLQIMLKARNGDCQFLPGRPD